LSRHGAILGEGIYRVGVSPYGPEILDGRFNTTTIAPSLGHSLLEERALDAYIDEAGVAFRSDTRSLYAVGALKRYLKKLELERIIDEYDVDSAFPLRVEVNYLAVSSESASMASGPALSELMDTAMGSRSEPAEATSRSSDAGASQATSGAAQLWPQSQPARNQGDTDSAVRAQIREMDVGDMRPRIAMEFTSDKDIIIPSLMNPPMPFAQVIVAFLYVLPVTFLSVFFTGSFMAEKTDRRITVLLSAPLTPFQIIAGKMLPYISFSLASVIVMTLVLRGNLLLALAIFIPVILFIFAIYLMVPLVYRTFRDTTFVSMLAIALSTSYLIFPAMFSGINDLCYISPLTLAVKMYRGESFGLREYGFSTLPMYLLFVLSMYVGTRVLNEEYLMGYRPLPRKVAEAIYDHAAKPIPHPYSLHDTIGDPRAAVQHANTLHPGRASLCGSHRRGDSQVARHHGTS
jgi:ABC-type Na+ efflux pump permease subunit